MSKKDEEENKSKEINSFINEENYLTKKWQVKDKLRILVFKGKNSDNDYPTKQTKHLLGVCINESMKKFNINFQI